MFEDFIIQNFVKLKKIKKSFAEKLSVIKDVKIFCLLIGFRNVIAIFDVIILV